MDLGLVDHARLLRDCQYASPAEIGGGTVVLKLKLLSGPNGGAWRMVEVSEAYGDRQKVWELIKDIGVALLVSTEGDGKLRGRPMVAINKDFDGDLWFISRAGTAKVDEIAHDAEVLLAYSEPKKQLYASVSGRAQIVRDQAKVKELWSEGARVWFPKGPEDPDIALIRVPVESAEYWDAPSSAWVYAFGYAKARLTGKPPSDVGENKVVNFKNTGG